MLLLGMACAAPGAAAHDVPADVRINVFAKPSGQRLQLLVRVPMHSLLDIEFPTFGPGYLDVASADNALRDATKVWIADNLDVYEDGKLLRSPELVAARISLASDRSFSSYEGALANMSAPKLPNDLELFWNQQLMDVQLAYPIESENARFAIHPRVDRFALRVTTALLFLPPGGEIRAFEFHGDPGVVYLDPGWLQAAFRFLEEGVGHILSGTDHLLFLVCLVIPFRRLRPLIVLVTAFSVAHCISLTAAAFEYVPDKLWFPPLVETLIAVTIFYMALENIVGSNLQRRWILAFSFGIIHGFGFSFGLREAFQFAGDHLLTALFAFNLGVELGQIAVLLVLVPVLQLLFRHVVPERLGIVILSAIVAHVAWHWMMERGSDLLQFRFPTIDAMFLAGLMRALIAVLVLAAAVALVNKLFKRAIGKDSFAPAEGLVGPPSGKS